MFRQNDHTHVRLCPFINVTAKLFNTLTLLVNKFSDLITTGFFY